MKAIVQTGPSEVALRDVDAPTPGDEEVLVQVHSAGICGSDAHAYRFKHGYDWMDIPRIMGHEYSGEIVHVGEHVDDDLVGQRVVESPVHECGDCFQCNNGQPNVCPNLRVKGMHTDGAFAEYVAVEPRHLHVIPSGVPTGEAVLTEPLSVATRAVFDRSTVTPGDNVLVEGPGPIGVLVAVLADRMGASVLVSGLGRDGDYRLPLVEGFGIETIDVEVDDLSDYVDSRTDGIGMDVVFDATGHRTGVESAVRVVRRGGDVVLVGLPEQPSEVFTTPLVMREVDIITSSGSLWRNFRQAFRLLADGNVDFGELMDTRFDVAAPEEAFTTFLQSGSCKPVFRFANQP